jgi:apolipoprotein N-acyltransferase
MAQALPWISIVVGATLFAVVTRVAVPPLTWLSLLLLLHGSRSITTTAGAACFWFALYLAAVIGWRGYMPVSGPIYLSTTAGLAITTALPFFLDRLAIRRTDVTASLLFPAAFVAMEFFRSRLFSTWGSIAYTQYGALPLMQLAAVVGIWGITFLSPGSRPLRNWRCVVGSRGPPAAHLFLCSRRSRLSSGVGGHRE